MLSSIYKAWSIGPILSYSIHFESVKTGVEGTAIAAEDNKF